MKSQLRLLRYIWPHWRGLVLVLVSMLLVIGLEALRPWPTKLLVDSVLGQQPLPGPVQAALSALPGPAGVQGLLLWVCVSTVLIFLIGTLMSMVSTMASVTFGQRMTYELGADLFLHLQRLSLLFHCRRPVGDTIARVTGDPYCMQTLVSATLLPLLQGVGTLVTMFIIMWRLDAQLTLLALGVAPFLVLNIWLFGKPMKLRGRRRRDLA